MRCLNCDLELDLDHPDKNEMIKCPCGIDYSTRFIETANHEEWEVIRSSKRFMRSGSSIMLFDNKLHG